MKHFEIDIYSNYFYSLNECAFICYQNACSNVLFELGPGGEEATEGSGVRLSKCHLDMESNTETCSGELQRHYSYPNINMTLMSCVRCVAKKPTTISPFAEIVARSTASTPTQTFTETNNSTNIPEETSKTESTYGTPTNIPSNVATTPIIPLIVANPSEEENKTTEIPSESTTILLSEEIITQTPSSFPSQIQAETEQFKNATIIEATGLAAIDTKFNRISSNKPLNNLEKEIISTTEKEEEETSTPLEEEIPLLPIKIISEHENINGSTIRPKSVGLAIPNRQKENEKEKVLNKTKEEETEESTTLETSLPSSNKEEEQHFIAGSINSLQNETSKPKTENSELKSNEEEEIKKETSTSKEIEATSEETKEFVAGGIFNEKPGNISEETLKTESTYGTPSNVATTPIIPLIVANRSETKETTIIPEEAENKTEATESSTITTNIPLATTEGEIEVIVPVISENENKNQTEVINEEETNKPNLNETEGKVVPEGINETENETTINPQNDETQTTSSPGFGPFVTTQGITKIKEENKTLISETTTISTLAVIGNVKIDSNLTNTTKEETSTISNGEGSVGDGAIQEKEKEENLESSTSPETEPKLFGIAQEGENETSEIPSESLANSTFATTIATGGTEGLESTQESSHETEIEGPIILSGSESNLGEATTEATSSTEKSIETNTTNQAEATTIPSKIEGIVETIVTTPETYEANATVSEATSSTEKEVVVGLIPIEGEKEVSEIPVGVEANATEETSATEEVIIGAAQGSELTTISEVNATTPANYEANATSVSETFSSTSKEVFGVIPFGSEKEITETPEGFKSNETTPESSSATKAIEATKASEISSEINTTPETYESNATATGAPETITPTSKEEIFGVLPPNEEEKEASELPAELNLGLNATTPSSSEQNTTKGVSEASSTSKEEIFGVIPLHEEEKGSSEIPTISEVNATTPGIFSTEAEILETTNEANETSQETTPISDTGKEKLGAVAGAISVLGASEVNATAQTIANETETKGIEIEGAISSLNESKEETPIILSTTPNAFETTTEGEFIAAMHETEAETSDKGLETNATTPIPEATSIKEPIVGLGSEEVETSGEVETNATTPGTYESNATTTEKRLATPETEAGGVIDGIHGGEEESSEITATTQIVFESTTSSTLESTTLKESLAIFGPGNVENETSGELGISATTPGNYETNTTSSGISEAISIVPGNETTEGIFGVIPFEGENEASSKAPSEEANATTPEALLTIKAEGIIGAAEINATTPETYEANVTSTTKEEIFGVLSPHEEEKESSELPAELNPELNATTPSSYEANATAISVPETSSSSTEEIFGVIPFEGEKEVSEIPSEANATTESTLTNETEAISAISEVNNTTEVFGTTTSISEENIGAALAILGASEANATTPEGTSTNETGEIIGAAQASEIPTNASNSQLTGFELEGVIRKINGTQKEVPEAHVVAEENNTSTPTSFQTAETGESISPEHGAILGAAIGGAAESNETSTISTEGSTLVLGGPSEVNATPVSETNITTTPETEAVGIFGVKPEEEKEVSEIPTGTETNTTISEANIATTETEQKIFGIAHDGKEEILTETNTTSSSTTLINEAENATSGAFEGNATSSSEGPISVVVLGPSELFGGATENATIHPSESEETTIEGEIGVSEANVTTQLETSTNESELIGAVTEEGLGGNISTTPETEAEGIFGIVPEVEETTTLVTEAGILEITIGAENVTSLEGISEANSTIEGINTTEGPINVAVLGPSELSESAQENATIQPEVLTTISEGNITSETTGKEGGGPIIGVINEETTISTSVSRNTTENVTEEMPELINAVSQVVDVKKIVVTEPTVAAVTKLVDFVESNGTIGEIRPHNILKDFGNRECNGEILFTGEILTDYTQSFEIIISSETVYECVKTCYLLNCTKAAFTHFPRSACLLHFNLNELQLEQKCENETEFVSNWNFKQIPEVVSIKCIKCEKNKKEEEKLLNERNERVLRDEFSLDNFRKLLNEEKQHNHLINPQGVTTKCSGRVEFNIHPVPELHLLDITNDVPADTAADCARKCFETVCANCLIAGFIPTPGHESSGGVCLLTKNIEGKDNCTKSIRLTTQHASTVPFLINCIKCTDCNYSLTISDSKRVILDSTNSIPTQTINECAIKCSENNCYFAKFDPNKLICSFALPDKLPLPPAELGCPIESGLQTDGIFDVLLNCVKCKN
uniref:Apple domain-containing protein n=1 Tax=Meloidogyne hapla TaxID=6305 RepID=A0A1I8BSA6_MELHA